MGRKPGSEVRDSIMVRYGFIFVLIAFFALLVAGMLFKTTVVDASEWNAKADSTLMGTVVLTPERGNILAADGSLLAVNVRFYEVRMDFRAESFNEDEFRKSLRPLCDSLSLLVKGTDSKEWERNFTEELAKPKKERKRSFLIAEKMSHMELERLKTFPYYSTKEGRRTLSKNPRVERMKPYGRMAYRSIGNIIQDTINKTFHGSSGLERALDSLLYGKPGVGTKVQLANGIRNWEEVAPQRGFDIKTTIDVRIQDIVEEELYDMCVRWEPEWATAVLMEVQTGDIKAISNLSRDEKTGDYYESVNNALRAWELGSVMKPISLTIALQDGLVKPDDPIEIGKMFAYAGAKSPITDTHGLGPNPTVTDVIAGSSNIGTARIITGRFDREPWGFRKRLEDIGFFDKLNIGLAGESAPEIQELGSPDKKFENKWRVNLSRCCYGYAVATPPIHNLAFINAIANDGKFVRPRLVSELWMKDSLVKRIPVSYVRKQICSPEVAKQMQAMLKEVVWSKKPNLPTASMLRNNFVTIAGKTGTSRIHVPNMGYSTKLRLTFCGFFPYEKPRYSCIVVFNAPVPGMRSAQLSSGKVLMNVALKLYARGMLDNVSDFRAEPDNSGRAATLMNMPGGQADLLIKDLGLSKFGRYRHIPAEKGKVPSVVGMGLREAVAVLERAGLHVAHVSGAGYVGVQVPAAGDPLKKGEKVSLQLTNW